MATLLLYIKSTNEKDAIGIIVHVVAPKQNISWSYTKGIANTKTNKPLDYQQVNMARPILLTFCL